MSCPFAKFATKLPFVPATAHGLPNPHHHHNHHDKAGSLEASSLSEALRVGTARSHRLVEKSKGVAMILQSSSSHASTSTDFPGLHFDRTNYIQWNVMLASIYTVLEAALFVSRSHPLLRPLFDDQDLVGLLARTKPLVHDTDAHLAILHEHAGTTLSDLAEHAREQRQHPFAFNAEDVECPKARLELQAIVECHASWASQFPLPADKQAEAIHHNLSTDHFDLLTSAQTHATLSYVKHITSLTRLTKSSNHTTAVNTSDNAGLLLAHAYTRYLGDLSGGQHIYRKVSKNFPITSGAENHLGFEFYHFESGLVSDVDPCQELKRRFRLAMESGFLTYAGGAPSSQASLPLVDEANVAFDLNTALFESLLPIELRMSTAELAASMDQKAPIVLSKVTLPSKPQPFFVLPGTIIAALTIVVMLYVTSSSVHKFTTAL